MLNFACISLALIDKRKFLIYFLICFCELKMNIIKLCSNLLRSTILIFLSAYVVHGQPKAKAQSKSTVNEIELAEVTVAESIRRIGLQQRAFFLEENRFALDWDELNKWNPNLGEKNQHYKYGLLKIDMPVLKDGVFAKCKSWDCKKRGVLITATAKRNNLNNYIGIVWLGFSQEIPEFPEYRTYQLSCESDQRSTLSSSQQPQIIGEGLNLNEVMCPDGFHPIDRR
jgi:hypothetical protein